MTDTRRLQPAQRTVFGVTFFGALAMSLLLLMQPVESDGIGASNGEELPFTVQLVNGAQVEGLARQFTDTFTQAGFTTAEPTDAMNPSPATVVYYRDGFKRAAQRVAAQLGKASIKGWSQLPSINEPSSAEVVVVLGTDRAAPP